MNYCSKERYLTLSLCLIGWAYLHEDQKHFNRRSLALLLVVCSAIIAIWIYTTRGWSLDYPECSEFDK